MKTAGSCDASDDDRGTTDHARIKGAVSRILCEQLSRVPGPGLHLVATPIGNIGDLSLRAIATIARADRVYCEDTRHTRKLLAACGIERRLRVYEEHGAARERPDILAALGRGESVAIVSDAGTPLISDPGLKLAREAMAAGHRVVAVPGPCAAIAGLTVSGLATDRFVFEGFLSSRASARRQRLSDISERPEPSIFFEAPNRVAAFLADAAEILGSRSAAVGRELTKLHEEVRRGELPELAQWAAGLPVRGEVVVVIDGATNRVASDEDIRHALGGIAADVSLRDAARQVARELGVPKSHVYKIGLQLRADRPTPRDIPPGGGGEDSDR